MSHYDKDYKILLELYKVSYAEIGADWDTIDKVDNFFMDYEIDETRQREIVEQVLSKYKLSKWAKNGIEISFYLGCSPKFKK